MNPVKDFLSGLVGTATTAAGDAAAQQAAATYERFKPLIYFGLFVVATVYVFFFLPRFRVPWEKAA